MCESRRLASGRRSETRLGWPRLGTRALRIGYTAERDAEMRRKEFRSGQLVILRWRLRSILGVSD